jgi:choline kinase
VPIADGRTVLGETLTNFACAGIAEATVVVGYCADAVERRLDELQERSNVAIDLVYNDRAEEWNNAYSLWCARDALRRGAVLANGDTLHPMSVELGLLASERSDITLAVDLVKQLGDEEMKVQLDPSGAVRQISKKLPWDATGEYIGVALIPAARANVLVDALERTWRHDPNRFYEDAFQLLADGGERVGVSPIGDVDWVEIDDHRDLSRALELACRS